METRFELMTACSDSMIKYCLSQTFNLLGKGKFNHLTILLTLRNQII